MLGAWGVAITLTPFPPARRPPLEGDDVEGVEQPDDELASGLGRQRQDVGDVGVGLGEGAFWP